MHQTQERFLFQRQMKINQDAEKSGIIWRYSEVIPYWKTTEWTRALQLEKEIIEERYDRGLYNDTYGILITMTLE